MDVVDARFADIAVLVGGARLVILPRIYREDTFLEPMRLLEQAFFQRVQSLTRPEVDSSELSKAALALLYPVHTPGQWVDVAADWLDQVDQQLQQAKADAKEAEARITAAGNAIKAVIGDAEGIRGGGLSYSWKAQARAAYTVPAGVTRPLRRHQGKLNRANGKT
jgi:hypothetical protein